MNHDGGLYPFLRLFRGALVTRGLRRGEIARQTLVTFGRYIVRVASLRTFSDDFGFPFVIFDKCAAHGKLTYTRFPRKQDGRAVYPVLSQRPYRLRPLLERKGGDARL